MVGTEKRSVHSALLCWGTLYLSSLSFTSIFVNRNYLLFLQESINEISGYLHFTHLTVLSKATNSRIQIYILNQDI